MLEYDATLLESKFSAGPLGAAVFVVRKAFETGGAPDKTVADFEDMAERYFKALSDADCNTLCDVLYHRLQEARSAKPDGRWYA